VITHDSMGQKITIPKKAKIEIRNSNNDENGNTFIQFMYKNNLYTLKGNDYFYFKYWFEKTDKNEIQKPIF